MTIHQDSTTFIEGEPPVEGITESAPGISKPARTRGGWLRLGLLPIIFYVALTIVMTYPLITDLTHSVARHPILGRSVDTDQDRWKLWWFKTAITERHQDPFYTDMLYYPYRDADNPVSLYYSDVHPLNMILGLPIVLLSSPQVGPTLAYNLGMMFHFVLAGCAMFWLVFYLARSTGGALVAGVLYAFCSLAQYHFLAGNLVLISTGWMPLQLLFLHKLLYEQGSRRRHIMNATLAVLFLLATSFTNWYLTVFLLIIAGILALVRVWERPREWRSTLARVAGVLLVWGVLVSPLLIPTIRAGSDPDAELVSGHDYEVSLSLTPLDFFTVTKDFRVDPAIWVPGTLGYSALLLAGLGALLQRRRAIFWIALVAVGAVLSLGPYLKFSGATYTVQETTGVPLPYLLFNQLPFMSIARVPRRFVLLAHLGLSVLSGFGVAYLLQRARDYSHHLRERVTLSARQYLPKALPWGALAILLLVPTLELQTVPQPFSRVEISPFLSQLGAEVGDFGILEFPITTHYARDHDRMFYQTIHGKKILGGYLSRRIRDYYLEANSPFRQIVALEAHPIVDIVPPMSPLAVCNYYNIPYIIEYKQSIAYERPQDRERVEQFLAELFPDRSAVIHDDEQLVAYRVPAPVEVKPLVWVGDGWHDPESENSGERVWRWSKGTSDLYIATRTPLSTRLQFTSSTFRGTGNLVIEVNGKVLEQVALLPEGKAVEIRVDIPAGQTRITFRSTVEPVSAIEAGISTTDSRKLAFVVTNLRIDY
jgi:hypothetical protein